MKTSTLLSIASLSAAALAAPAQDAPRSLAERGWIEDAPESLAKRDWVEDTAGGNAEAAFADGEFRFGHVVPSSTLDALFDQCGPLSCQPGEVVTVDTWYVDGNYGGGRQIRMTVDGVWASDGNYGDLRHLVSLATGVFEELYNQGGAKRQQGVYWVEGTCPFGSPRLCQGWQPESGYVDQWTSTDHVTVRFKEITSFLDIGYSYAESGNGYGICDIVDSAGTFLGLANTFAAAGAGLASLTCKAVF